MAIKYFGKGNKIDRFKLRELDKKLQGIVGFGAALKKGSKLTLLEINNIVEYSSLFGADKNYVRGLLENRGRPYLIYDPYFKSRCNLCKDLRNYCCC